jgi:DNA gyrase subunit B
VKDVFETLPGELNVMIGERESPRLAGAMNEPGLKSSVILDVGLRPTAFRPIQGRLRDMNMPVFDQLPHLPVEERQQEGADVRAVDAIASELTTTTRSVSVGTDEEHNACVLQIENRSSGYPHRQSIGIEFVASAEYRALLASFQDEDVHRLTGPMLVSTIADTETSVSGDGGNGGNDDDQGADDTPGRGAEVGHPAEEIGSLDELVEFFLAAGRRGVAINRYKGLGEMNPDQLWATTMKPDVRTLLQVRAEDDAEADLMFTTLMGDHVEPRRKFIEDNALDVKNLDV